MKVLVTGSTGLLGINTTQSLLAEGHQVAALARDLTKARKVLPASPMLEIWEGDLETPEKWLGRLGEVQAIIHGAAYFRESFGVGNHVPKLRALNVEFPVQLVQRAIQANVQKIVVVSSSLVLCARKDGTGADESDVPQNPVPDNLYAGSKVEMEAALKPFADKITLIIARPGWMFGPNDYAPTSAGELVRGLLKTGKTQLVDGSPTCIADARDVSMGLVRALERAASSTTYNLAGHPQSALNALREVAKQAGRGRVQVVPLPIALGLSRVLDVVSRLSGKANPVPRVGLLTLANGVLISSAKAQRELGITFRPFPETARDSVAFFRQMENIAA